MLHWLKVLWCHATHGGGNIKRDNRGRINWQCDRCGRWSDYPVERKEERRVVDRMIEEHRQSKEQ